MGLEAEPSETAAPSSTAEAETALAELITEIQSGAVDVALRQRVVRIAKLHGGPAVLIRFLYEDTDYKVLGNKYAQFNYSLRYRILDTLRRMELGDPAVLQAALQHVLTHPQSYWEPMVAGVYLTRTDPQRYKPIVRTALEQHVAPLWERRPGDPPLDEDLLFQAYVLSVQYGREDLFPRVAELYSMWAGDDVSRQKANPIGRHMTRLPGDQQERLISLLGVEHPLLESSIFQGRLKNLDLTQPAVVNLIEHYFADPELRSIALHNLQLVPIGDIEEPLYFDKITFSHALRRHFESEDERTAYLARSDALELVLERGIELANDPEVTEAISKRISQLQKFRAEESAEWPIGKP